MCDKCKIYRSFPGFIYCPICSAPLITNDLKSNLNTDNSDNAPLELEYMHRTNYNQRNENK